ncbi:hypothetical protein GWI33_016685 [Rhynchophorus ferrugineus]|uniref:Uncharacterized protein n=1 Tax=Rhynchophorus ferrugineus TaxID=354439 RepID=A0A834MA23_RHYFE|nr:hypothetical protein GWI33_016685 [Rhynchophorus ferrugineus]
MVRDYQTRFFCAPLGLDKVPVVSERLVRKNKLSEDRAQKRAKSGTRGGVLGRTETTDAGKKATRETKF